MILYLDTSALLKLYVQEDHTDYVRSLVGRAEAVTTSVVAYPEARAALVRAADERRLDPRTHASRVALLNADWNSYVVIGLTGLVAQLAGELAEKHRLRGFDAVHLASAISTPSEDSVTFLAFDERLTAAAGAEGLSLPGR